MLPGLVPKWLHCYSGPGRAEVLLHMGTALAIAYGLTINQELKAVILMGTRYPDFEPREHVFG
jgi:hypothetical protein